MLTEIPILDDVLGAHEAALGADFAGYRNHTYRVVNLCTALSPAAAANAEKVAIAAAFHDLGIWTAGTFDYLPPSRGLAAEHLARQGPADWASEIDAMIAEHHKLLPYRAQPDWLVEPFRKADLVDVSRGLVSCALPRKYLADVFATWPSAGFHKRLVQLTFARACRHPFSALPMLKL